MADDGLRIVSAPEDDGLRVVEPPKPATDRTERGYEPLVSDKALQAMIEDASEAAGAGMEQMSRGNEQGMRGDVAGGAWNYILGAMGLLGSPFAPLVKPGTDLAHEQIGPPVERGLKPIVGQRGAEIGRAAVEGLAQVPYMLALGPEMATRPVLPKSLPIERGVANRIAPIAETPEGARPVKPTAPESFTLTPAPLPADTLPRHAESQRAFTINGADGQPVGHVRGSILDGVDGKFFNIDMIENTSGERLNLSAVRGLVPQLEKMLPPEVTRIAGTRVSGARHDATGARWGAASIDRAEAKPAVPREPTGYILHEAPSTDGLTRFEVLDADGKRVANVSGQRQGDAFFINSVAPEPGLVVEGTSIKPGEQIGPNDLGPAIVRDLMSQLLAKTGTERVMGERITGARAAREDVAPKVALDGDLMGPPGVMYPQTLNRLERALRENRLLDAQQVIEQEFLPGSKAQQQAFKQLQEKTDSGVQDASPPNESLREAAEFGRRAARAEGETPELPAATGEALPANENVKAPPSAGEQHMLTMLRQADLEDLRDGIDPDTGHLMTGPSVEQARLRWLAGEELRKIKEEWRAREAAAKEPLIELSPTERDLREDRMVAEARRLKAAGEKIPAELFEQIPLRLQEEFEQPSKSNLPAKRNELTTTDGGGKGGPPDITFGPRGAFDDGFGGGGIAGDVGSGSPPKKLTFRSIFDELHNSARSVGARIQARLDPLRIKVQDKMLRLKRVEEATERARALTLPDEQSAYLAEELYHGITGEKLERFRIDDVDPLVDLVAKSGAELDDLNNYLMARHAIERNRQMARINPDMPDGGSGMTNAEAVKTLQDFGPGYGKLLEGLANDVYKITDGTLDILVEGGLITPEQRALWKRTYRNYVPLKGFEVDVNPYSLDSAERARIGQGWDIRGPESKRALGRKSRAGDILSHVIMAREEAIVRAEKNRVGQAFLRFVQENPDPRLWRVDSVPVELRLDPGTGLALPAKDTRYMLSDNVLGVKTGGQQHFITIKDPALARAIKNLGAESMNGFFRALAFASRTMSKLATQLNPAFTLPNFARDLQTALVNIKQFKEADIPGISKQIIANVPYAARAIFEASRGRRGIAERSTLLPKRAGEPQTARTTGGKMVEVAEPAPREYWQMMAHEFAEHGGKINFFGLDDLATISARIRRQVDSLRPGKLNEFKKGIADTLQLMTDLNTSVENATRLATYEALRRSGVPANKAASVALNLTVNFYRKGEWSPYLNATWIFFNAAVQGPVTTLKALVKSRAAKGIAAGGVVLGTVLDQLNNTISQPGPDGVSEWDKITPWEKDHNFILMLPGDLPPIKFPMAYGLNIFPTMGRRVSEMARGAPDVTPMSTATGILSTTVDTFNFIGGGSDMFTSIEGAARGATPSVARPFVEIAVNQDYAGRPVQRPKREFGKPIPEAERGFGREGPIATWIAKTLAEATGGTKHQSGNIDVSPAALDHIFEAYTGGLGRFITQSLKLPYSAINDPESFQQPRNWPVLNRFIGSKNQWYTNARFYAARDAIEAVEADWRDYMRKGDRAGIASLRENNGPEFSVMQQFNGAQKQLEGLYKQRKLLNATPAGARQQQERIDALEDQIRAVQARAIKAYQDALKREGQR